MSPHCEQRGLAYTQRGCAHYVITRVFIRTATRSAMRGGRCLPRVAAALPALPEATLLTPPRGALAATRHTYKIVHKRCGK
jgi:hypothetical protein